MKKIIGIFLLAASMVFALAGCSKAAIEYDLPYEDSASAMARESAVDGGGVFDGGEGGGESEVGGGQFSSGVVTAGEWNDIEKWGFWANLLNNQEWGAHSSYWKYYPYNFVYVTTVDASEKPAVGARISLLMGDKEVWNAQSDNAGHAVLWASMYESAFRVDASEYSLKVNGKKVDSFEFTTPNNQEVIENKYVASAKRVDNAIDVAFIVDATGSMGDEIGFLKADLKDIITLVGQQCTAKVRTATVFYRDQGDRYVTKFSQFTGNVDETINYIGQQNAEGGGDWPEAVHEALETGLQKLSWSNSSRSRVAFLILDAPPHHEDDIIASCQKSIEKYAETGIKIVPVAASGIDKACEYLLRSFAMSTNGTYVFITNDSGVGNEHIEATVGEYQVEKLKDLIARLIIAYAK